MSAEDVRFVEFPNGHLETAIEVAPEDLGSLT